MLVRKLVKNFVTHAKIETTLKKAKVLKSVVERLVEKAKKETEANKNYLFKALDDKSLVKRLYKEAGTSFKDKVGGYVRIVRLGIMREDGAETARLEWTRPVIAEKIIVKKAA
ncbi:50S ribosomal protein L17 [Candidatus Roizmanbacteria bacterium RIFCSPHIGHO2_01_FULL_35_10]|uniref:50S ribosomal protein L17 n=1 Tax=Candidatus Roizmanbacteria bacterium RIFCSPLOWO2_01_FULL_35_13 TaxID=1802055 RepID=A0A1F7I9P9_9BACT|nr:MAG: 50S ribosomal protein L17 [Candidatus Roizmanbacteria bacterium RIFCSPHIGHO2_01_FULL_35_10]OGK40088.1 MAG: 50S ribosomal protein L17 [Candidatus Roizmanbacteria bacterium RIFCSPLOWO2_01_FULL_35_13]